MENKEKIILTVLVVAIVVIAGAAAVVVSNDNDSKSTDSLYDVSGTKVKSIDNVESITAASPSTVDLICYLGYGNLLKCVANYSSNPDIPSTVTKCGSYSNPDTDAISTANSTLTILDASGRNAARACETLRSSGMDNVYLFYGSDDGVDGVYTNVEMLGILLGCEEKADNTVTTMKSQVSALGNATSGAATADVLITTGFGRCRTDSDGNFTSLSDVTSGIYSAGASSTLAGFAKQVSNVEFPLSGSGWSALDSDFISTKTADVDVIFIVWSNATAPNAEAYQSFVNALKADDAWSNCGAVQQGHIVFITGTTASDLSRNTPYTIDDLGLLSLYFNTECFSSTAGGSSMSFSDLPTVVTDGNVDNVLKFSTYIVRA